MIPAPLTDDRAGRTGEVAHGFGELSGPIRGQLSVREIALGLEMARELATQASSTDDIRVRADDPRSRPLEVDSVERRSAAQRADAVDPDSRTTAPTKASPTGPWVPDHDGPVLLSGVAAPRTRTARRSAAPADKAPRRPSGQRESTAQRKRSARTSEVASIVPVVAEVAARSPRLVVVTACGGAGATTAAVLLAAALAPATGVLLLANGADRGSLITRTDADGGDADVLAEWATEHRGPTLQSNTPGTATGDAGSGPLFVAAAGPGETRHGFCSDTAVDLFVAAASTSSAVLLDWSSADPLPDRGWDSTTHVIVVAPSTAPGLLAAEYAVQNLEATMPGDVSLSLLTTDVRGRSSGRSERASLSRLRALRLPITSLPYDSALADDPRVRWLALRPRTRSAVIAALANLRQSDQPRKDER